MRAKLLAATALTAVVALGATACSSSGGSPTGPTSSATSSAAAGVPQPGGTLTVLNISEPRTLLPASMNNSWTGTPTIGNAVYGTLISIDAETQELVYDLAESLTTADNGATWVLTLRDGVTFTDGTPLDAAAVQANWEFIANPANGSASRSAAALVKSFSAKGNALTLTLADPMANFPAAINTSSLTWIASPKSLATPDANPVGAGPFKIDSWTRGDKVVTSKNPDYWDAPKPYLDGITFRAIVDEQQRLDTITSGGADAMLNTNPGIVARAVEEGMTASTSVLNGGTAVMLNFGKAPFDDPRAREAFIKAIDTNSINAAVYEGHADIPTTLFNADSPLFTPGINLPAYDPVRAQELFNELASEGKPVEFTLTTYNVSESQKSNQTIQALMSTYENTKVEIEVLDYASATVAQISGDYQAISGGINFVDPEPSLYATFHSDSPANTRGISDPQMDAALEQGRASTDVNVRKTAYAEFTQRITDLYVQMTYMHPEPTMVTAPRVQGEVMVGLGSPLMSQLWVSE